MSAHGDALLRWTYRRRWWLRLVGVVVVGLGVGLLAQAAAVGASVVGAVFGLVAWTMQVLAWGWFIPALGRRRLPSRDPVPRQP